MKYYRNVKCNYINPFIEYSMWLLIYYLSTTTEDRGSLTVEESLDMEDHFMRGGSIKEQERSNLLGNMNQKVCLRNNYTRSVFVIKFTLCYTNNYLFSNFN